MRKIQVDTPRAGSWAETCNRPIPLCRISDLPATFQEAEILRRTQLRLRGYCGTTPELAQRINAEVRAEALAAA